MPSTQNMITANVLIIVSELDVAGKNMQSRLMDQITFEQDLQFQAPQSWPDGIYKLYHAKNCSLIQIPNNQIKTDYFKDSISAKLLIFASKHSSAMGKKALLVHTTGIWGKESGHGGNDHEIAFAPSLALTTGYKLIKKLKEERQLSEYWIGVEVTHHGPSSLETPVMYIETGGTEEEWNDIDACNLIADVILDIVKMYNRSESEFKELETKPAMIGIGGGHYAPSFIKKLNNDEYMHGHIIPKYSHEFVNDKIIRQAWDKTVAQKKKFLIDKKGTKSKLRHQFIEIIESLGYPWEYT